MEPEYLLKEMEPNIMESGRRDYLMDMERQHMKEEKFTMDIFRMEKDMDKVNILHKNMNIMGIGI